MIKKNIPILVAIIVLFYDIKRDLSCLAGTTILLPAPINNLPKLEIESNLQGGYLYCDINNEI